MPILAVQGVPKRFGLNEVLKNVTPALDTQEIRAICGENGAGKSTLVKILSGIYQPDAGEIRLNGELVVLRHPADAQAMGISTVHQELNLIPHLDVGKNVFLGREPVRRLAVGSGLPANFSRLGLGSKVSTCDGPPFMNR